MEFLDLSIDAWRNLIEKKNAECNHSSFLTKKRSGIRSMDLIKRTIKSYVLRAGRFSPRQEQGLNEWLAEYQLPLDHTALWDNEAIFGRQADLIVEIGFGMGASLVQMAQAEPDVNFIGIEVHRAGIGALAADLHDSGITNVRIAPYDAVMVFAQQIPKNSLSGIQIFFPDPWPKKRHQKRRLVQSAFVQILVQALKPGGYLHCATDWADYAEQMLAVLNAESGLVNQAEGYAPRPARRPLTKFEQRGQSLGHGVWDLLFCKK